jgi:hypothetical protein
MLPADHFLAIAYCTTSVPVFTRKPESAVNSSRPTACGFAHSGVGLIQYQDSDTRVLGHAVTNSTRVRLHMRGGVIALTFYRH